MDTDLNNNGERESNYVLIGTLIQRSDTLLKSQRFHSDVEA